MTWARLDDSILTHPKTAGLSAGAGWLWVRGLVLANQHLTDGHLSAAALRVLGARPRDVAELVAARLWHRSDDGGAIIHDFAQWNDTRSTVEQRRASWKERQQRSRGLGAVVTRDSRVTHASVTGGVTRDSRVCHDVVTESHPIPSHEDPSLPSSQGPDTTRARETDAPAAATAGVTDETPKRGDAAGAPAAFRSPGRPQAAAEEQTRSKGPSRASNGHAANQSLEERLRVVIDGHPAMSGHVVDLQRLVDQLATAGDARRPEHVLAAVRRALDDAAVTRPPLARLVRSLVSYAQRASERDMPPAPPPPPPSAIVNTGPPPLTPEEAEAARQAALLHAPRVLEILLKEPDPSAPRPFVPRPGVAR